MEWLRGRSHRRPRRNAESFHRAASRSCGMRSRSERAGAPRLPGAAGRTLPCRFVLSRRREPPTIREVWFFFQMVDRRREASGVERRLGADRSRRPWVIVNRRVPNKIGIVLVDSPLRCEAMGRLPPGGDLSTPNFLDEVFRCLAPKASFFLCVGNAAGAARSTQHAARSTHKHIQFIADCTANRFPRLRRSRPVRVQGLVVSTTYVNPSEWRDRVGVASLPVRIQSRQPAFRGNKPFRFASSGSRIPSFPPANVCALPCQIGAGRLSPSILDAPDGIAPSSAAYIAPYHPLNRTAI